MCDGRSAEFKVVNSRFAFETEHHSMQIKTERNTESWTNKDVRRTGQMV